MDSKSKESILSFSLGGILLGAPEDTLMNMEKMRKAGPTEVHLLEQTGMLIAPDEVIYLQDQVEIIGPEWAPLVVVKKGKVKMVSIQRVVRDEQTKDRVWDDALLLYTHELGGPAGKTDDRLVWELSHGRKVMIEKREIFAGTGGRAVTIILSCENPEELPTAG
jgi:hypothetical protein